MRRALSTLPLFLALASGVAAQTTPFDMSGEGTATPRANPPAAAPAPAGEPEPAPEPATPPQPATPSDQPATQPDPAASADAAAPADPRRFLVPMGSVTLAGETASRSWGVVLTEAEAAGARTIQMAYQSSILVAPEASRLRFVVNGRTLIDTPVQSPDSVGEIAVAVPADVLRPGLNTIRFEAMMRHRTDCTVQSTYDLWAEIDGARTFIDFTPGADLAPRELEDVRAVGFDETGRTRIDFVVPNGRLAEATPHTVRLAQGFGVLNSAPNQSFAVSTVAPETAGAGRLPVFLGPADLIAPLLGTLPETAGEAPFADFVSFGTGHALLVTGPDWGAVATAVERIVAPTDRPASVRRDFLVESGWQEPDVPLVFGRATLPLSSLGVRTEEFSGRRYRTEFQVGVPADFYAEAYGEATLVVDMAYTAAVRPGSRFDIYVNGNIATTLPIGSVDGEVVRRFPVPLTMRHFVPGTNTITVEASLDTAADTACLPGTAADTETRFVLFDSSTLEIPSFARISSRPNLSAMAGVGYPYVRIGDPIPLILADTTPQTLSAAATLTGRIAQTAGRPIPFDTQLAASAATGRDAVFIGPAARIPAGVLPSVGISEDLRLSWSAADPTAVAPEGDTQADIARWNERVGSTWGRPFERFQDWLQRNFDLSLDALRITNAPEPPFLPPTDGTLLVAQGIDPSLTHSWTVISARTGEDLAAEVARLAEQANWTELAGRVTYRDAGDDAYVSLPAGNAHLVPSVEPSFANLRLVTANWLSERPLVYALVLAFVSILLGATTGTLATNSGRHR